MKKAIVSFIITLLLLSATVYLGIKIFEAYKNDPADGIDSPPAQELMRRGVERAVLEMYLRNGNNIRIGDGIHPISSGSSIRVEMSCGHRLGGLTRIDWDASPHVAGVSEDDRSLRTDTCTNVDVVFADLGQNVYHQQISITNLTVDGRYSSTVNCVGQGIDWFCRETASFSHSRDRIDLFVISPEEQELLEQTGQGSRVSLNWFWIGLVVLLTLLTSKMLSVSIQSILEATLR
jgi:hypothetical protein